MTRVARLARAPWLVPCVFGAAYLILLVIRFPQLVAWENGDSDIASAYVLADAISHGHTGPVVMSTQGSWAPLWYGLLTHGLGFHRVLWELSASGLTLAGAVVIGISVAALTDFLGGILAIVLILAASPTALFALTGAFVHNTTMPGAALLAAYLVWITWRNRSRRATLISGVALSLLIGVFLASDEMLAVVGIIPFLGVVVLRRLRTGERDGLAVAIGVTAGSVAVATLTSAVMHSLNYTTTTPALRFTRSLIPSHLKWLVQGLLRLGNGLSVGPHGAARTVVVVAAAAAVAAAIGAMYWTAARSLMHPAGQGRALALERARETHLAFWAASLLCAAVAYVVTTVASTPTDRYLIIAVPAVAASVPVLARASDRRRTSSRGRTSDPPSASDPTSTSEPPSASDPATGPGRGRSRGRGSARSRPIIWATAAGATAYILAGTLALAANDERRVMYDGAAVAQVRQIESFVKSQHLSVGYAGYWDAANLDWISHGKLHVYPITDRFGKTQPMYLARVGAWYRPRPNTPSYLLLAPFDADLANAVPPDLPAPARKVAIGPVTLAIYPYDLAAHLHPASPPPWQ